MIPMFLAVFSPSFFSVVDGKPLEPGDGVVLSWVTETLVTVTLYIPAAVLSAIELEIAFEKVVASAFSRAVVTAEGLPTPVSGA